MRPIDADELKRVKFHGYTDIEITPSGENVESYKRGWNDAIDAIMECEPTAERKKGKWEIYVISMVDGEDCRCSECGMSGCTPYWKFCPNCGAEMLDAPRCKE